MFLVLLRGGFWFVLSVYVVLKGIEVFSFFVV